MAIFLITHLMLTALMAVPDETKVRLSEFDFSIRRAGGECEMPRALAQALAKAQSALQLQGLGLKLLRCPPAGELLVEVGLVDKMGFESPFVKKQQKRLPLAMQEAGFQRETTPGHFRLK